MCLSKWVHYGYTHVYGLYLAMTSDATILSEVVKHVDDPFIDLDCGFRDCIEDVNLRG